MADDGYRGPVWVELYRIDTRLALGAHNGLDENLLAAYTRDFKDLPPIKIMAWEDDKHWLIDGAYRFQAAKRLGKKQIECLVKWGTPMEASRAVARNILFPRGGSDGT